jgi:UDP-GlcNAc:undecaprenyl-phosphate GlcNAc-1-phosphate transferase
MSNAIVAALVLLGALVLSLALMPMVRAFARRNGIMDDPGPRKVHAVATPRMGGLGVFIAFCLVVVGSYASLPLFISWPWARALFADTFAITADVGRVQTKLMAVLAGGALAFLVGLLDDVLGQRFPVVIKALGQVTAALLPILAGVRTTFMPYEWMNVLLTLLWLVGITNAFNLLDNMDGLAAGVACLACACLLINAWALGEFLISLILVAFMGSLLGFLFFNFHPASVFLGDCGSLFIGFMMGSLTLLERYVSKASSTLFPVLMPVVVLAIPIVDTATVVFIRVREGRPIYVGDSRHLSHRLLALGFSHRATALFIYLATFILGLGAANLTDATVAQAMFTLLQSLGFVALLLILMFYERRERDPGASP